MLLLEIIKKRERETKAKRKRGTPSLQPQGGWLSDRSFGRVKKNDDETKTQILYTIQHAARTLKNPWQPKKAKTTTKMTCTNPTNVRN